MTPRGYAAWRVCNSFKAEFVPLCTDPPRGVAPEEALYGAVPRRVFRYEEYCNQIGSRYRRIQIAAAVSAAAASNPTHNQMFARNCSGAINSSA